MLHAHSLPGQGLKIKQAINMQTHLASLLGCCAPVVLVSQPPLRPKPVPKETVPKMNPIACTTKELQPS